MKFRERSFFMKKERRILSILLAILILFSIFPSSFWETFAISTSVNESYVSQVEIKEITDGLAPFDKDNEPGNDTNESNRIVRSFDNVNYTIEYVTALKTPEVISDAYLMVEFVLPCEKEVATFDMDTMAWMLDAKLTESDGKQILTGKRYLQNTTDNNAIPGAGTLSVGIKVQAAPNGTKITPSFSLWMEGNSEEEIAEVVSEDITVSAAPKYNVVLKHSHYQDLLNYFDFDTGDMSDASNENAEYGRLEGYGLTIQLYNDSAAKGMKGIELPTGDIKFDITMKSEVNNEDKTFDETYKVLLWDYNENCTGAIGHLGRNMAPSGTANYAIYAPRNESGRAEDSCYHGGNILMEQDENQPNVYHVTIQNYQFDTEQWHFPTRYLGSSQGSITYGENVGCFSAGFVEFFSCLPKTVEETSTVYQDISVSNLNVTSTSGQKGTERVLNDNRVRKEITLYPKGSLSKYQRFTDRMGGAYLSSDYYTGDNVAYQGDDISIFSFVHGNNEYCITDFNLLQKFDDEAFDITSNDWQVSISNVTEKGTCSILYAAKPDKSGWESDQEMQNMQEEELIYFTSIDDLKDAGYTCIGVLYECRDIKTNPVSVGTTFASMYIPIRVKDSSEIGSVYQTVSTLRAWRETSDPMEFSWKDMTYSEEDKSYGYGESLDEYVDHYTPPSNHVKSNYTKVSYKDGAMYGHTGGYANGNSLLVLGYEAKVNIEIDDKTESNETKTTYDMDKGERTVNYRLSPSTVVDSENENEPGTATGYTDLQVKVQIPKDLSYDVGSASLEPTDFTENADGTQTLVWDLKNVEINTTLESITFSCTIGEAGTTNDVSNNQQISIQATITGEGDIRETTLENGNYSETAFTVIKLNAISISKSTDTPYISVGDEFHYTFKFANNSQNDIYNAKLYDVLPYNGDGRGSDFSGFYQIDSITLDFSHATKSFDDYIAKDYLMQYTTDSEIQNNNWDAISHFTAWDTLTGKTIDKEHHTVTFTNIPANTKGLLVNTSLMGFEYVEVKLNLHGTEVNGVGQQEGDIYVNDIYQNADGQIEQVHSNAAIVQVYGTLHLEKVWDDANDQDGMRPDEINVNIYANDTLYETVTLTEKDQWQLTMTELPMWDGTTPISYTAKEVQVSDKYQSEVSMVDNKITITNSHTPEQVQPKVIKTWNDVNNADGIRPESVQVLLYSNLSNTPIEQITLSNENAWSYTSKPLDKYANGQLISYWFEEVPVTGYTTTKQVNGYQTMLTNTHIPEYTEATVIKKWDDGENADGIRPDTITFQLLANGTVVQENLTMDLSKTNRMTIDGLLKYEKGIPIQYTFQEVPVEGYTPSYSYNGNRTTVTNFHEYEKAVLVVEKVWEDAGDANGIRPSRLEYQLFANGQEIKETDLQEDFTLSSANGWSQTLYGIRKTEVEPEALNSNDTYSILLPLKDHGTVIDYSVVEPNVPDGYQVSYSVTSEKESETVTVIHLIMTNTTETETVSKTVEKVWDDENNRDGKRPDEIQVGLYQNGSLYHTYTLNEKNHWTITAENLPDQIHGIKQTYTFQELSEIEEYTSSVNVEDDVTTITNHYQPKVTSSTVKKIWNDEENRDGIRPTSIQVALVSSDPSVGTVKTVTLNETNNWTYTESKLPKYYQDNGTTKEVVYTWTEQPVLGYVQEKQVNGNHCNLINTHVPDMKTFLIEKVWDDQDNIDGLRPDQITFDLFANGQKYSTHTLTEQQDWKLTLSVPEKINGTEVKYTIREHLVDGYITQVSDTAFGFVISNRHEPERVNATVNIYWDDENDIDGLRPESLYVLLQQNGTTIEKTRLYVSENGSWQGEIRDLPKYDSNGDPYVYTFIYEEPVVPGYVTTYEYQKEQNHTDIYNIHRRQTTEITVEKIWNDDNNRDGKRPENLEVSLKQNNKTIDTLVLNQENHWTVTKEDLPLYINGNLQTYTVQEKEIPDGYVASMTTEGNKVILTNTYEPETMDLSVEKVWDDQNDQDGKRPSFVTIALLANGSQIKTVTLSESNHWETTVQNLPVNENGVPIQYEWREMGISEGYTPSYQTIDTHTVITNHYDPEVLNLTIQKIWEDHGNQDGIRSTEIQVNLYGNSKLIQTLHLSETNQWMECIEDLPRFENGEEVKYEITEPDVISGYTSEIIQEGTVYSIVNSHKPETITATVQKVWDDFENADHVRPESVNVVLMKNGSPMTDPNGDPIVYTLSPENHGYTEVPNLPKYENGKPIQYVFVLEDAIDEYTSSSEVSGQHTTITSVHRWPTIDLTVQKIWQDGENADGMRPNEVQIGLLKDGTLIETLTLDESNGWKTTVENLRKSFEGHTYEYQFVELSHPEGYLSETEVQDTLTTITNVHEPEKTHASVEHIWKDHNNADGIRPDEITVVLTDGTDPVLDSEGNPIELILNEENDWSGQIDDLTAHRNGEDIHYTFVLKEAIKGYTSSSEWEEINHTRIISIHDPERITVNVKKVWENDTSDVRPTSIQIMLLQNGEETDQILTLNEENNWSGSFVDLLKYENGTEIFYTVKEVDVPDGYTSTISQDGYEITITNTYEKEESTTEPPVTETPDTPVSTPEKPEKTPVDEMVTETEEVQPQTGDTTPMILLLSLLLGSSIALFKRKKK